MKKKTPIKKYSIYIGPFYSIAARAAARTTTPTLLALAVGNAPLLAASEAAAEAPAADAVPCEWSWEPVMAPEEERGV